MADAFGLAVNLLTILDIGRKFASLAWDIYNNDKYGIPGIASLELTSKDLDENARQLQQLGSSSAAYPNDQTNERIRQLTGRCTEVAARMQQTLIGISTHKMGRNKRSAVVNAFRFKWNESDIKAFQMEIEELRDELMLNLMISLRNGMRKSLHNQDAIIQELAESRSRDKSLKTRIDQMNHQQEGFCQQIVEILSSTAPSLVRPRADSRPQTSLEMELMDAARNAPQDTGYEDLTGLQMSQGRLALVRNQFINIFRYDGMFDREAGVADAHPVTLKWIFEDPSAKSHMWDNFRQWLESEDQLYWISGKMGSGKSTLMKYISEELPSTLAAARQPRCTPYLLRWAQDRPLFMARFYFWAGSNEETRIQSSVEGLYRTLLTQILKAYPDAAPHVSPHQWENVCLFNKTSITPGITELKNTLARAIEYASSIAKVCLFIDGLDELEGSEDDLVELITWIKILVETSPVKLCVASRPWRIFEDALHDRPHLLMEDFNHKDIQKYVWRRFHDDINFEAKSRVDPFLCNQLLDEIVSKAEGVFLWVYLVCTRLLQAMSRGDLVGRLRQILQELPEKMETLYDHILDNLELYHKDPAAKYFLLLQEFLGRPDALIVSFADDIDEDNDFSLNLPRESLTKAQLQYRVTEVKKRINSRCKGLLSLTLEPPDSKNTSERLDRGTIQYFHRSVKDYLALSSTQEKLAAMMGLPFDPHIRLCSAYLARLKSWPSDASDSEWRDSIYQCVEHAKLVVSESHGMMIRIIDDLDLDIMALSYMDDSRFGHNPLSGRNLLSFTVARGVNEYVKCKIRRAPGCVVRSSPVPLPRDTGRRDTSWRGQLSRAKDAIGGLEKFLGVKKGQNVEWPLLLDALFAANPLRPEMVSLLLENGADPNPTIPGGGSKKVPFDEIVYRLMESMPDVASDEYDALVNSVSLLLRYGAKPHKSYVLILRKLIGEDVIHKRKLPYLGRHRFFIFKHTTLLWLNGIHGRGLGFF